MKAWSLIATLLASSAVPAFAADANLFQVFNFDRSNDGVLNTENDLPGRLWVPSGPAPEGGYSVVTFFHGFGERGKAGGTLNTRQVEYNIDSLFAAAQSRGFILYAPQSWDGWNLQEYHMVGAQMAKIMKTYDIDTTQVYATGISNGGMGTWQMATKYDDVFAAAVPVSALMSNLNTDSIASPSVLASMPIWAFHTLDDDVVPVSHTRNAVNAIRTAKNAPTVAYPSTPGVGYYTGGGWHEENDGLLRYSERSTRAHTPSFWNGAVYNRTDLYDWMLAKTKDNPQNLQAGETLRFDLGSAHIASTSGGNYWNSTTANAGITSGVVQGFAITEAGRRTGVFMAVTNTFQGDTVPVTSGLSTPGRDAWYVQNLPGADNLGQITLESLEEGWYYDLVLFGSSVQPGTVQYTVNGIVKTLNFQNNTSITVAFDDVLVDSTGRVIIDVQAVAGSTTAYLNWFTITAVPEPAAVALLGPGVLLVARRRRA